MPIPAYEVVHSQLNRAKCFEKTTIKPLNKPIQMQPINVWLNSFCQLLHTHLTQETKERCHVPQIERRFIQHIFVKSYAETTAQGKALSEVLQYLRALLLGEIQSPNGLFKSEDATSVAEKIYEGLFECTPGFHNRVNSIWYSLCVEKSFLGRLENIRNDLLQRATTRLLHEHAATVGSSYEVHFQNSISIIAEEMGLGTIVTNRNDPYPGLRGSPTQLKAQIKQVLTETFQNHYSPLLIIAHIENQILGELLSRGYHGGEYSEGNGYPYEAYSAWHDTLNQILPASAKKDLTDWLITPPPQIEDGEEIKDNRIINLNWPLIRQSIFKQLVEGRFLSTLIRASEDLKTLIPRPNNSDELKYWLAHIADQTQLENHFSSFNLQTDFRRSIENFLKQINTFPENHFFYDRLVGIMTTFIINASIEKLNNQEFLRLFFNTHLKPTFFISLLQHLDQQNLVKLFTLKDKSHNYVNLFHFLTAHPNHAIIEQLLKFASEKKPSENAENIKALLVAQYAEYPKTPFNILILPNTVLLSHLQFAQAMREQKIDIHIPVDSIRRDRVLPHPERSARTIITTQTENAAKTLFQIEKALSKIENLDPHRVETLNYLITISMNSQPVHLPWIFNEIKTLPKAAQMQALRSPAECELDQHVLGLLINKAPEHLPAFLTLLKTMDNKALIAWMCAPSLFHDLSRFLRSPAPRKTERLLTLLEFIEKQLPIENQQALLSQLSREGIPWGPLLLETPEPRIILRLLELQEKLDICLSWDNKTAIQNVLALNPDSIMDRLWTNWTHEEISIFFQLALKTTKASEKLDLINLFLTKTLSDFPMVIPDVLKEMMTLEAEDQLRILSTKTVSGKGILTLAEEASPSQFKSLIEHLMYFECSDVLPLLELPDRLYRLRRSEDILALLRLMKYMNIPVPDLQRNKKILNQILAPQDWYEISREGLLPTTITKHKKEVVYNYIRQFNKAERDTNITEALEKETGLGKLFWAQRGFFKCRPNTGTLKKLTTLLLETDESHEEAMFNGMEDEFTL